MQKKQICISVLCLLCSWDCCAQINKRIIRGLEAMRRIDTLLITTAASNLKHARERETSQANRILGGLSIGVTGVGGMLKMRCAHIWRHLYVIMAMEKIYAVAKQILNCRVGMICWNLKQNISHWRVI